ncbi:MAG: hypothetical protein K2F52_00030 [Malacoplasma sp.]|nr:hypothetical protein [Malacoplasma sp.]
MRKLFFKICIGLAITTAVVGGGLAIVTTGSTSSHSSDTYTPTSYSFLKPFTIKDYEGINDLEVSKESFINALKSYGASQSNPMEIDYITPFGTLGPLNTAMYNQIQNEINSTLSDGLINFSWLLATNANPSSTSWFTQGNSEMGFLLWSADYDDVGTWISAWFNMDENGDNKGNYLNTWKALHDRIRQVLNNKDYFVNNYSQSYYDAALDLLKNLENFNLYNKYTSSDTSTEADFSKIPLDYKQAFKDIGKKNSGSLKTDFFFSQIFLGETGRNMANFIIQVLDDQYLFMSTPSTGFNYRDPMLKDPQLIVRDSPFQGTQIRDYGIKKVGEYVPMNKTERGVMRNISSVGFFDSSAQIFNHQVGQATPYLNQNDVGQISLINVETTGSWENDNPNAKPIDHWRLNGATELKIYDKDDKLLETFKRENDLNFTDSQIQNLQKAVKYEFKIDTAMQWVDENGNPKQNLSGKDFERGFEAYWLSSMANLQQNSYFINTMNLDLQKTVNNYENAEEDITSQNYDVNNFTSTDDTFTVYVREANTLLYQYLATGYFWALPNTNEKVKSIKVGDAFTKNSDGTFNINYSKVYGDGSNSNDVKKDFWSVAPYYLSNLTDSEATFSYNKYYFDARKNDLLNKDDKVQKYIIRSIPSVNAAALYEFFNNGQTSSALIPSDLSTTTLNDPSMQDKISYIGASKTSQSNYAIWNGNPYDSQGNPKDTISPLTAKFLSDFTSDNARIIRAGINGFINWFNISLTVYTGGDFVYSAIPYGVYTWNETEKDENNKDVVVQKELYEEIYKGLYNPFGIKTSEENNWYSGSSLPRPIIEYIDVGIGLGGKEND